MFVAADEVCMRKIADTSTLRNICAPNTIGAIAPPGCLIKGALKMLVALKLKAASFASPDFQSKSVAARQDKAAKEAFVALATGRCRSARLSLRTMRDGKRLRATDQQ